MQTMRSGWEVGWLARSHRVIAMGAALLLALMPVQTASAQQRTVGGTVRSQGGNPLPGVSVRAEGTEFRTTTNEAGRYSIAAPANGVLLFSMLGQRAVRDSIRGRSVVDVRMEAIALLDEVIVTAYSEEQRRGEITGAVASVNMGAAARQNTASVLQRLDATVSGVTVNASGSPGGRSTVRIRGISSFQNNDPLYIVDGTPVQDTYANWLNPNDIASVQVLKDASAASIYGSRASNGVIIIETTKRGASGPPRVTFSARTGIASPTRGYDDFLITDALEYHEVVKRSFVNAGLPVPTNIYGDPNSPRVPAYIWPNNCTPNPCSNVNTASYSFPSSLIMPGSAGTNWWDAVFRSAPFGDYNLGLAGGSDETAYSVSFNYFNQVGTARYNDFKRGSVRANTSFTRGRLSFGENVTVGMDRSFGGIGNDGVGENTIVGKNILTQPVVPVYDINGNFASGKAVGLGNNTNPLKLAFSQKDNITTNTRVFGNVFAGFAFSPQINLRTRFGFNLGQSMFSGFTDITPENSEPTLINSFNENQNQFTDWTWSNTLKFDHAIAKHGLSLLLGQEANAGTSRFIGASLANLLSSNVDARYIQDALGDAASKNVASSGGKSSLLSFFGKADWNFDDRYVASFTVRQDGSSRLGPNNRWGTFPSFGLGWRISNESFFPEGTFLNDVNLRYAWGITGNQSIPSGRIVSQFGGSRGDTYYDISGANSSVIAGFRQASLGNPDLKWEENRSTNVGADITMLGGKMSFVVDVYQRDANNLLFNPPTPATAGLASPPFVNIGKMQNTGVDLSAGYNTPSWSLSLNGSKYKNKIVSIDGVQDFFYGPINTRFGNQVINKVGHPIGSFFGQQADGFFRDAADVAAHARQDGAAPGRIKFRDTNGDGRITLDDRTIIGSPHPDFTAGLDFGLRRGPFELNGTFFGSFGNEIFDVQKEFYVFRNFSTNVRKDLLTDSWTPENPNAKYPKLDVGDVYSRQVSSFYVEDGSYVRLRNLQLGYNVPPQYLRWLPAARIFVQADNLFTVTGYDGVDPALPVQNVFGAAGDIRDQYRGVDRGTYPSSRMFSIGLTTNF